MFSNDFEEDNIQDELEDNTGCFLSKKTRYDIHSDIPNALFFSYSEKNEEDSGMYDIIDHVFYPAKGSSTDVYHPIPFFISIDAGLKEDENKWCFNISNFPHNRIKVLTKKIPCPVHTYCQEVYNNESFVHSSYIKVKALKEGDDPDEQLNSYYL